MWLSAWLPTPCVFCGGRAEHAAVCDGCRADLPGRHAPRCPVCAIDMPQPAVCGACLQAPPAFVRAVAAASYAFPLDAAIARLKYGKDLSLVSALGGLLYEAVRQEAAPHMVVPMPLSSARLRTRGFNHAAELARVVACGLNLRVQADAAVRTRDAVPQASLPLAERAGNVRGAFACPRRLPDADVVIVDDVMTSGASLSELARELRRAGARSVGCWVLARTPRPA
jgi:ComF family protein